MNEDNEVKELQPEPVRVTTATPLDQVKHAAMDLVLIITRGLNQEIEEGELSALDVAATTVVARMLETIHRYSRVGSLPKLQKVIQKEYDRAMRKERRKNGSKT